MAGVTHRFTPKLAAGGTDAPAASYTRTAGSRPFLYESIPGPSTNLALTLQIDVSAMKSLYIYSAAAMTLKFNDSGSPSKTITLVAGEAFEWADNGYFANPFGTTDVTALYVTYAGEEAADLYLDCLQDPTP